MRISDWSSDVCSSDLTVYDRHHPPDHPDPECFQAFWQGDRGRQCQSGHIGGRIFRYAWPLGLRRLEERSVGEECVSTCWYRRSHTYTTKNTILSYIIFVYI